MIEPLAKRPGMLGRELEKVLDAALRVIGERIHAAEVLLGARDPERWPALGERARRRTPASRRSCASRATSAVGSSRGAGRRTDKLAPSARP